MNRILIVAHAPLAKALRDAALHVFSECAGCITAIDIGPSDDPLDSKLQIESALNGLGKGQELGKPVTGLLILTDVFGATPCNVAQQVSDSRLNVRLIAGVNLPMVLRALSYRQENLDSMVSRAIAGGTQGIMPVGASPRQNQNLFQTQKINQNNQDKLSDATSNYHHQQ